MSVAMTDRKIERMVSVILRAGVTLAGSVVLIGGVYFLWRHAREPVNFATFHSADLVDRSALETIDGALHLRARSIIQLGILLLIATPISRVAFSLVGFTLERDKSYVITTAIVLAILLYSLLGAAAV